MAGPSRVVARRKARSARKLWLGKRATARGESKARKQARGRPAYSMKINEREVVDRVQWLEEAEPQAVRRYCADEESINIQKTRVDCFRAEAEYEQASGVTQKSHLTIEILLEAKNSFYLISLHGLIV